MFIEADTIEDLEVFIDTNHVAKITSGPGMNNRTVYTFYSTNNISLGTLTVQAGEQEKFEMIGTILNGSHS